jgi:hypothetical protein
MTAHFKPCTATVFYGPGKFGGEGIVAAADG